MFRIIGSLVAVFFTVLISCTITKKTGYNWWMGILFLIPFVNIIFVIVFAFSEWPVESELKLYKERLDFVTKNKTGIK